MYYKISKEAEMAFDSGTKDFTDVFIRIQDSKVCKIDLANMFDIPCECIEEISEETYLKRSLFTA